MARQNIGKLKSENEVIFEELKSLMGKVGTYNESFDLAINYLSKLIVEHKKVQEQFEKTGGNVVIKHTNKAGATNYVKNPLYQAIEQMRSDILNYLRDLGLTPTGLKKINQDSFSGKSEESPLTEILKRLM